MAKKFKSLSEKAEEIAKHYQKITDRDAGVQLGIILIMQLNKEFIRTLKDKLGAKVIGSKYAEEVIDKLAGDKLITKS